MEIDPGVAQVITSFILIGVLVLSVMFFAALFAKMTVFFMDWIAGEL